MLLSIDLSAQATAAEICTAGQSSAVFPVIEEGSSAVGTGDVDISSYEPQADATPCGAMPRTSEFYDWAVTKTHRQFAHLEAKVLANQQTAEEQRTYSRMLASRRAFAFSKNYVQNYAETHRLRMLSKKLEEIQQYLRPLSPT